MDEVRKPPVERRPGAPSPGVRMSSRREFLKAAIGGGVSVAGFALAACGSGRSGSPGGTAAASPRSQRAATPAASPSATITDPTDAYLAALDLNAIVLRSSDYAATVSRRPASQEAAAALVQSLQQRFRAVDRARVLKEVFRRLTVQAQTETDRLRAILYFVQRLSVHDFNNPAMSMPIFDPLLLFEISAMDCQKCSRMIAALYQAAGYRSRLVDLYGHMVAEISYNGGWHYADADVFGGGEVVTMQGDQIPSMAELSNQFALLDRLPVYLENQVLLSYDPANSKDEQGAGLLSYPSSLYFNRAYFVRNPGYPAYLVRNTPLTADPGDMTFGWNTGLSRQSAADITLHDVPDALSPGPPGIESFEVSGGSVAISLAPQPGATPAKYRVLLSGSSRGWSYGRFNGATAPQHYWDGVAGWKSQMYDALFRVPPSDSRRVDSVSANVRLDGLQPGRYYLSVMALDAYGESIGKVLWPSSNELAFDVRSA